MSLNTSTYISQMPEHSMKKTTQRRTGFRGLRKFVLRCCGEKFNPKPQPSFSRSLAENSVLPQEIWATIFHYVCADAQLVQDLTPLTVESGPETLRASKLRLAQVQLTQVCRYWYIMIVCSPTFWNKIQVYLHSRSSEKYLRTWLARSQSAPVSMYLDASVAGYKSYNTVTWLPQDRVDLDLASFEKCVKLIHQHAWHMERLSLRLDLNAAETWSRILTMRTVAPEREFPILHSVEVRVSKGHRTARYMGEGSIAEQQLISLICARSPITSLKFGDRYTSYFGPSFIPQFTSSSTFAGVVSLTLKNSAFPEVGPFLQDLAGMPRLRALWLISVGIYGRLDLPRDEDNELVRLTLSNIRELHLVRSFPYTGQWADDHAGDYDVFLNHVSLPNLATVEVDFNMTRVNGGGWYVQPFLDMMTASLCTLRKLILWSKFSHCGKTWDFLSSELCSELEELTLRPYIWLNSCTVHLLDGSHRTFARRQNTFFTTPFFPSTLKRLVIYGCILDDGVLAQVAKSRMQDCSLEYLYVEAKGLHPEKHSKDIEAFKELRRLGYKAFLQGTPQSIIQSVNEFIERDLTDLRGCEGLTDEDCIIPLREIF